MQSNCEDLSSIWWKVLVGAENGRCGSWFLRGETKSMILLYYTKSGGYLRPPPPPPKKKFFFFFPIKQSPGLVINHATNPPGFVDKIEKFRPHPEPTRLHDMIYRISPVRVLRKRKNNKYQSLTFPKSVDQ